VGDCVREGVNVTAESFYSSQGRIDDNFDDDNAALIDSVVATYPEAKSMEMETFTLLHLALCSKTPIYASAAAIVVANRRSAAVIKGETLTHLEEEGGRAILEAVCKFEL
jgi:uridine phosphorylase